MNNRSTKFLAPLGSLADWQGLQAMHQAVNSLLNGKIVNGKVNEVYYSDSNVLWQIAKDALVNYQTILPFAFYNNPPDGPGIGIIDGGVNYGTNDELTLDGGTLEDGETATTFRINGTSDPDGIVTSAYFTHVGKYKVDPVFPNSPTGGAGSGISIILTGRAEDGRIFSMRDGAIGIRPRFSEPPHDASNFSTNNVDTPMNQSWVFGNYKEMVAVRCDEENALAQPAQNLDSVTSLVLNADTPTLISGYDVSNSNTFVYPRILINAKDEGRSAYIASFWLEIIDTPSAFSINLWGKAVVASDPFVAASYSDTSSVISNIIPVAICYHYENGAGVDNVVQFLIGNQLGLFDSYFNKDDTNLALGTALQYRGDWDDDGLDGQTFYPGDLVTQGTISTAGAGGFNMKIQYVCKVYVVGDSGTGADPLHDSAHWITLSK